MICLGSAATQPAWRPHPPKHPGALLCESEKAILSHLRGWGRGASSLSFSCPVLGATQLMFKEQLLTDGPSYGTLAWKSAHKLLISHLTITPFNASPAAGPPHSAPSENSGHPLPLCPGALGAAGFGIWQMGVYCALWMSLSLAGNGIWQLRSPGEEDDQRWGVESCSSPQEVAFVVSGSDGNRDVGHRYGPSGWSSGQIMTFKNPWQEKGYSVLLTLMHMLIYAHLPPTPLCVLTHMLIPPHIHTHPYVYSPTLSSHPWSQTPACPCTHTYIIRNIFIIPTPI